MFSLIQRFQSVSNVAMTWSVFGACFIMLSSWFHLYHDNVFDLDSSIGNIKPSVNVRNSRYFGSVSGKPKENLKLNFDLNADLSPLFNWNTKQVFVYLTAEYPGTKSPNASNEVTFWDFIIKDKEHAQLNFSNLKSKYSGWDVEERMSGRDLVFKLHWNIQPWIGPLIYGDTHGEVSVNIPNQKEKIKRTRLSRN
ncbi:signal peptidase complex subunit SPC3 Ecym_1522 [Eremothecium cymbalariae DBVPG|uniref:Signal peptidase subunit 3 n=1 Tax=Eremothecium cymbalariae (strain CBS 270.75 / DBVPG 7215 / KCTC 17166 / NRRL Y-17582) TaxID=931890 RepID=G8JMS9_ERECY|nr:hypothetical protein Ecym_1522 [Eremothecium cymbalariae DBVPG\